MRKACFGIALTLGVGSGSAAWAQPAPAPSAPAPSAAPAAAPTPAAPVPVYIAPPPGYMYVPIVPLVPVAPAAAVAPGAPASLPPPGYSPAPVLPYVPGQPIPNGYRLFEEPRRALVTTGWILTGVSYGAALFAALSSDFDNSSEYLVMPVVGPWLTLGKRDYAHCPNDGSPNDGLDCAGDAGAMAGLIVDGLLQATGVTLLLTGYLAPTRKLVYIPSALSIRPRRTAGGYGLSVGGVF